ncbi:MAG TPA: OmpA family protein [Spongiibacteraceae bacterium]|nr:OmpA family protein [Spongiibacteraceae bacterium]
MASFDRAQWQVQSSRLACRMTQEVPRFGAATFETVGGGQQRFVLRAKRNPLAPGAAELSAAAPIWNPSRQPVEIGDVEVAEGKETLQLDAEPTRQLLDSLRQGLVPTFARPLRDDAQKTVKVALSPVNFRTAYHQYNDCVAHLWPVTFDDIKNTVIEFAHEQSELSADAQKKIDFLLRYIALDSSIKRFEIYGVSSDNPRRLENIELAKQRTQQVSEYLMSRGIDAKAIESSYHGERGSSGKYRSVSIRLIRSIAAH